MRGGAGLDDVDFSNVRAVSFDVDGTLYDARRMRWRFLLRNMKRLRALRVGRRVREELSGQSFVDGAALRAHEADIAAQRLDVDAQQARAMLDAVFDDAVVAVLRRLGPAPGVRVALQKLVDGGITIGVVSDRRVDDKLDALGLGDLPWRARSSADVSGVLKPAPRAFLLCCDAFALPPAQVLHVGDREDKDGVGAKAAGMPFVLTGQPGAASIPDIVDACLAAFPVAR